MTSHFESNSDKPTLNVSDKAFGTIFYQLHPSKSENITLGSLPQQNEAVEQ
jgi:hypothetical protein